MDITVILPCAGEGSRLNLGYPKELYEIFPGRKLIDFSLLHILESSKNKEIKIEVSVVITAEKEEVYNYVKKKLPTLKVNKVYFNNNYYEWPGSVYSAMETFSEYNFVLLPDTNLRLSKENHYFSDLNETLIETGINKMKTHNVVFGYIKTKNEEKIKNLGAMRVKEDNIVLFKDKPIKDYIQYNSYWGCYGFKKNAAKALYEYLINSVLSDNAEINLDSIFKFGGFQINSFNDLGTWKGIDDFLLSETNSCSSIPGKT